MTHMLLSDCYRDVGTATAYKTGQRDNVSIVVCPVVPPCSTYVDPAQGVNSTVTCLA